MALSKVWVHAELTPEGAVAPISLEILAKAREIADVVSTWPRRLPPPSRAVTLLISSCSAPPTTAATSPPVCR